MNKLLGTLALTGSLIAVPFGIASADEPAEGCYTGEYLGAPIEVCPRVEPDPTNCYTGDYQGAPVEVCLPTGESLPGGTTNTQTGQSFVIHNQTGYEPPAAPVAPAAVASVVVVPVEPAPLLVVRGRW